MRLSTPRRCPGSHLQTNEPTVFRHLWLQYDRLLDIHSSTSVMKYKNNEDNNNVFNRATSLSFLREITCTKEHQTDIDVQHQHSGPSGLDSDGWKRILTSKVFGDCGKDLRVAVANATKRICTEDMRTVHSHR